MPKQNETVIDFFPTGSVGSGAVANVDLGVLQGFAGRISSKIAGGWAALASRPYATSAFGLAVSEAIVAWNTSNSADVTSALTAIGTTQSAVTAMFPSNAYVDQVRSFVVSSKLGSGLVDPLPFVLFRTATDYRAKQKTGSFDADLTSAMQAWS